MLSNFSRAVGSALQSQTNGHMHKQITVVFYTGVPKVTVNKNLKKKKKDDDFLRSTKRTWLSKAIINVVSLFWLKSFFALRRQTRLLLQKRCLLTSYRCSPFKVEDNFGVIDCLSKKEQEHQY